MRISDWSSDVGSSDLIDAGEQGPVVRGAHGGKGGPREIAGRRYQGLVTGGAMDRVQFHGAWKIDRNFDHIERIDPQLRRIANQGRPGGHPRRGPAAEADRKSTRLNSSH